MNDFAQDKGYTSSDQDRIGKEEWIPCRTCSTHIEKWDAIRTGGICPNCGDSEGVKVEPDVMPEWTANDDLNSADVGTMAFHVIAAGTMDEVLEQARFDGRFTRQPDIPDDFEDRARNARKQCSCGASYPEPHNADCDGIWDSDPRD